MLEQSRCCKCVTRTKNILFRLAARRTRLIHYGDVSLGNASRIFLTFVGSSVEIWMLFIIFNGHSATGVEFIKMLGQKHVPLVKTGGRAASRKTEWMKTLDCVHPREIIENPNKGAAGCTDTSSHPPRKQFSSSITSHPMVATLFFNILLAPLLGGCYPRCSCTIKVKHYHLPLLSNV